jgi:hypothetical protein
MKKVIGSLALLTLVIPLVSWGFKGHRVTAQIANDYLTPQAKQAVRNILVNSSLSDVSTWADEIKNDPQYSKTASWHFLNLPVGLNYEQFVKAVYSQDKENVFSAILTAENKLANKSLPLFEKKEALKFLVHLIGDAHQPMHISRAEDKGGNTIQVRFDGKGTNLHSLWDSKLIDHEGLSEADLTKRLESRISIDDIKAYQADKPIKWLYESYTAATNLYSDVAKDNNITEQQYKQYIEFVHERLIAGGLRLAGVLNDIFKGEVVSSSTIQITKDTITYKAAEPLTRVNLQDVGKYMDKVVAVQGKVFTSRDMGSMVLVNLGAAFPNQLLTVVFRGEAKSKAMGLDGKDISVQGKLIDYKGKPEIIITNPADVSIVVMVGASTHKGG